MRLGRFAIAINPPRPDLRGAPIAPKYPVSAVPTSGLLIRLVSFSPQPIGCCGGAGCPGIAAAAGAGGFIKSPITVAPVTTAPAATAAGSAVRPPSVPDFD